MKTKITNTKRFISEHRTVIVGITGVLVGVALTRHFQPDYRMDNWGIGFTKEALQKMIDDPKARYEFMTPGGGTLGVMQIDPTMIR